MNAQCTCSTYLLRIWSPSENNNHFLQKMVTHERFYIYFCCWSPIKVWRWVWSLIRNNVGVYTAPPPIHSHPNSDTLSPRKAFNNILFPFRMICFCQDILSKILWLLFLQTFVSCFQNSWHWKGLDRNKIWINTGTVLLYELSSYCWWLLFEEEEIQSKYIKFLKC